jgi:hypothetical protein
MTYTKAIHDVFHMKRPPRGVLVDLVEYDGYFALRLYRENFDSLPESKRVSVLEWVNDAMVAMNMIIPTSFEMWEKPPEASK